MEEKMKCMLMLCLSTFFATSIASEYADSLNKAAVNSMTKELIDAYDRAAKEAEQKITDQIIKIDNLVADSISCMEIQNIERDYLNAIQTKEDATIQSKITRARTMPRRPQKTVEEAEREVVQESNELTETYVKKNESLINAKNYFDSHVLKVITLQYEKDKNSALNAHDSSFNSIKKILQLTNKISSEYYAPCLSKSKENYAMKIQMIVSSDTNEFSAALAGAIVAFRAKNEPILNKIEHIIDSLKNLVELSKNKIRSNAIVEISGQVKSIESKRLLIYGVANLFGCDETEDCNDEGISGILHEESNIIIGPYLEDLKISGKAIIGEYIQVYGYKYLSKSWGNNAMNGKVPIYNFVPCNCLSAIEKTNAKIDKFRDDLFSLLGQLGISEADLPFMGSL